MPKAKPVTSWSHVVLDAVLWRSDVDAAVRLLNAAADKMHAQAIAAFHKRWGEKPPEWARPPQRPSLTIEDEKNEYDSLEDVRTTVGKNPEKVRLSLVGSNGAEVCAVSLTAEHDATTISASGAEDLLGTFAELREIVQRHGRTSVGAMYFRLLPAVAIAAILVALGAWAALSGEWIWALAAGAWVWYPFFKMPAIARLRKRGAWLINPEDDPSFWRGNRDKIAVGVIMLIAGAIVKTIGDAIAASLAR